MERDRGQRPAAPSADGTERDWGYARLTENAALGSFLNHPEQLDDTHWLPPEAFTHPARRQVYDTLRAMREEGQPIDPVTVVGRMKRDGVPDPGRQLAPSVAQLANSTPTALGGVYYAQLVLEEHVRDNLRTAGVRLQQLGDQGAGDPRELLQHANREAVALEAVHDRWRDATRDSDVTRNAGPEVVVGFDATGEPLNPAHRGGAPAPTHEEVLGYEVRVSDGRQEYPVSPDVLQDPVDAYALMVAAQQRAEERGGRSAEDVVSIVEVGKGGAERDLNAAELDQLAQRAQHRDTREVVVPDVRLVDSAGYDR